MSNVDLVFFTLPCCSWTLPLGITLFRPVEMPSCKESKHRKVLIMKFLGMLKDYFCLQKMTKQKRTAM